MAPGPNYITVGRNLAMELVRVTEVLSQHIGFSCCLVLAFTRLLCCTSVIHMLLPLRLPLRLPTALSFELYAGCCTGRRELAGKGEHLSLMTSAPAITAATPQLPGLQLDCHADTSAHLPGPAVYEFCAS